MSDTASEKVELGQSAYAQKSEEVSDSTMMRVDRQGASIGMIRKNVSQSGTVTVYVRVNFDSKRKKDAYRKMNRKLGEG